MSDFKDQIAESIQLAIANNATELDLSGMNLRKLPNEILNLKQLKRLLLVNNRITELPPQIERLEALEHLDLNGNLLNALPKNFAKLKQLKRLSLSHNRFTNLAKSVRELNQLEVLDIGHNLIGKIGCDMTQFKNMKRFYVNNNKISKLPAGLFSLEKLQVLDASNNQLQSLPSELGKLNDLYELHLNGNELKEIADSIGELHQLQKLDLRDNMLVRLPETLSSLKKLSSNNDPHLHNRGLNLGGNKLNIPEEVLEREPDDLIQYIVDLQSSTLTRPLHEAKLIFVGSGAVGKTSLINMILAGTFNQLEAKTDGIEIREWEMRRGRETVRLHIWDFGGQEIMHATHKFFMTRRSAYVLVLNPRAEDKYGDSELEYWMKLIRSYAGDVPVVICVNKCDVHRVTLPKGEIGDKYPNIVGFVETSCKENQGIGELKRLVRKAVSKLNHIDNLLPESYFDIKQVLEERNDDHITVEEYTKICEEIDAGFGENSRRSLLQLLHDLGVMLHFGEEDRRLRGTHVLNPEWVTQGVYQVITSTNLLKQHGILTERHVARILNPEKYKTDRERFFIMDMMDRFELCYQIPDRKDTYFVPGAFPKDRPRLNWHYNTDDLLRFQFHYDILPSSVMSRFIVKVHDYIRSNHYWRNGVVLHKDKCDALIKADAEERKIYIEIGGKGNKRDILTFIRSQFDIIHRRLSHIEVQRKIPVDQSGKVVLGYEDLLFYEEMGEKEILVRELRGKVNVKQVLNGISSEGSRKEERKEIEQQALISSGTRGKRSILDETVKDLTRDIIRADARTDQWYDQLWIKFVAAVIFLAALAEVSGFSLRDIISTLMGS